MFARGIHYDVNPELLPGNLSWVFHGTMGDAAALCENGVGLATALNMPATVNTVESGQMSGAFRSTACFIDVDNFNFRMPPKGPEGEAAYAAKTVNSNAFAHKLVGV